MFPAWSIIFFTVISGLGLGLAAWLVLAPVIMDSFLHLCISASITFGLIGSGLLSSTLHLGHPERAWRALSQWRSSWLSREGVLVIFVLFGLGGWFIFIFLFGSTPIWIEILIFFFIVATVFATSMIYASLKTVACWYNPITPLCYLMFSACGGAISFCWLFALFGQILPTGLQIFVLALLLSAWLFKCLWWRALDESNLESTIETATGLGSFGEVRSLMPPHTSKNYLQNEMGFVVARQHAVKLRVLSLIFGGFLPFICISFDHSSLLITTPALFFHLLGVFIERWLFFAEAKHVVTLYYGDSNIESSN